MDKLRAFLKKHPLLINILAMVLIGVILVWGALFFLDYWTMHGSTAVVPDIRNMSYAEARQELARHNLGIEIADSVYDTSTPRGTVIESMPRAGASVKKGRQVYVTITAFTPKQVTISMPIVGNVSERQAVSYLRGLGLTDIRTTYVPSDFPDLVVSAKYGNTPLNVGTSLPINSTVTLEIGTAPVYDPGDYNFEDSIALDEDFDFSTIDYLSDF